MRLIINYNMFGEWKRVKWEEPVEWDWWRAYLQASLTIGNALLILELVKNNSSSKILKEDALRRLKHLKEGLETNTPTYLSRVFEQINPEAPKKVYEYSISLIEILEGKRELAEDMYRNIKEYLTPLYDELIKKCYEIEERIFCVKIPRFSHVVTDIGQP
jgi:hypothetical protein